MPDIAQIYAAALVGGPSSSKSPVRIYVRDHVCTAVPTNPGVQCDDRPISAEVQRSVRKLLGNKVEFVAHTQAPRRQGVSAVIVFGALTVTGAHATLGMEVLCGPLCGQGETLVLTRRDGRWRVTGTTGPEWIS
jgi:hypothetical protein